MSVNLSSLPPDLPRPLDDGGCAHLAGLTMPPIRLASTQGGDVDVSDLSALAVIFAYPMTGQPSVALPDGWDAIPGARGCTPQSCAFRDLHAAFLEEGASVYGLSTQATDYQREMAERLHLPYAVLSDEDLRLTEALKLPILEVAGLRLIRRLTLVVEGGRIVKVFYPVFPPDLSADPVLDWLRAHRMGRSASSQLA